MWMVNTPPGEQRGNQQSLPLKQEPLAQPLLTVPKVMLTTVNAALHHHRHMPRAFIWQHCDLVVITSILHERKAVPQRGLNLSPLPFLSLPSCFQNRAPGSLPFPVPVTKRTLLLLPSHRWPKKFTTTLQVCPSHTCPHLLFISGDKGSLAWGEGHGFSPAGRLFYNTGPVAFSPALQACQLAPPPLSMHLHPATALLAPPHIALSPPGFLESNKLLFSFGLRNIRTPIPFSDFCPNCQLVFVRRVKSYRKAPPFPSAAISAPFRSSLASAPAPTAGNGVSPSANPPHLLTG